MSKHDRFVEEYGGELLEEIFLCFYGDITRDYISIHSVHKRDAINSEFMATIYDKVTGEEIMEVSCRDGNWDGSIVQDYGDIAPPKRYATVYRLKIDMTKIKDEKHLEIAKTIYNSWKDMPWFSEMEGAASYDMHFCPTSKVKNYWKEKASSKGLVLEPEWIEVQP